MHVHVQCSISTNFHLLLCDSLHILYLISQILSEKQVKFGFLVLFEVANIHIFLFIRLQQSLYFSQGCGSSGANLTVSM